MQLRILVFLSFTLTASCSNVTYYKSEDAPQYVKEGGLDYRLGMTQILGPVLAPVLRNMRLRFGNLQRVDGIKESLISELQPFDILLTKSSPSIVNKVFPGHFTHALVWIGTDEQLLKAGLLNHPSFKKHIESKDDGMYFIESSQKNVHYSNFKRAMLYPDEILVARANKLTMQQKIMIYNDLKSNLGKPYDVNFNFHDTEKLTCLELINDAYPNIKLPVRYTFGRYALIPDDLARVVLRGESEMTWISHMVAKRNKRRDLTRQQSASFISNFSQKTIPKNF